LADSFNERDLESPHRVGVNRAVPKRITHKDSSRHGSKTINNLASTDNDIVVLRPHISGGKTITFAKKPYQKPNRQFRQLVDHDLDDESEGRRFEYRIKTDSEVVTMNRRPSVPQSDKITNDFPAQTTKDNQVPTIIQN